MISFFYMKIKIYSLITFALLTGVSVFAQKTRIFSKAEAEKLERDKVAGPFPIFRAFEYSDSHGYYDLLLCENKVKINGSNTLNNKITAVCFLQDHGGYREQWSINDQIDITID